MKRILVIVMIFLLVACQKQASFEVSNDGVVIDGIDYEIASSREILYEYNENDQMIKRSTSYQDKNHVTEFIYEEDVLIKELNYDNGELSTSHVYHYDAEKLVMEESISVNGLSTRIEYQYEGNQETLIFYNSDGSVSFKNIGTLDENGHLIYFEAFDSEDNLQNQVYRRYENDKLVTVKSNHLDGKQYERLFEYNKKGDLILSYFIRHDDPITLYAIIYEHEYEGDNIVKTTQYDVNAIIDAENIREID